MIEEIIILVNGKDDVRQGSYGGEILTGLRSKFGQQVVNHLDVVDPQDSFPEKIDYLIIEDEVEEMVKLINSAERSGKVSHVLICYSIEVSLQALSRLKTVPLLMSIDLLLRGRGGDLTPEYELEMNKVLDGIQSNIFLRDTVKIGISRWADEKSADSLVKSANKIGAAVIKKQDELWDYLPSLLRALLTQAKNVKERSKFTPINESARDIAHRFEEEAKKNLIGIDNQVSEIKKKIKPFIFWLHNEQDNTDVMKIAPFVPGMAFIGEMGSGKTQMAEYILNFFGYKETRLYREDFSVGQHPREWEGPFRKAIQKILTIATGDNNRRKVVPILLDDFYLPKVYDVARTETSLAVEWNNIIMALREVVEDTELINKGSLPKNSKFVMEFLKDRGNRVLRNTKMIWILTRNLDTEIGNAEQRFLEKLGEIRFTFPREFNVRKRIIQSKAAAANLEFAPDAIKLATMGSSSFSGRKIDQLILQLRVELYHRLTEQDAETETRVIQVKDVQQALKYFSLRSANNSMATREDLSNLAPESEIERKFDLIENALNEGKAVQAIAAEMYPSAIHSLRVFDSFWRSKSVKEVLMATSEEEASNRWPNLLRFLVNDHAKMIVSCNENNGANDNGTKDAVYPDYLYAKAKEYLESRMKHSK